MEVYILLKGYDFEGWCSNVEVFDSREKAEARKQEHMDGIVDMSDPHLKFDLGYDWYKIVKKVIG